MPDSLVPALPPDLPASEDLLRVLLNISPTGIMVMRPVYDASGATIIDLDWVHLNPAGQQMLQLSQRPAESFLTLYPTAGMAGVFAFYRDAFLSDKVERRQNNYQQDGLDGYFFLVAQRQGEFLVVNFTDTNDQPRTAVEEELRASQARELAARAEAETERNLFQAVLTQSPVAIGLLQGDDCVVTTANEAMCTMWGHPAEHVVGRPLLDGVPELRGQGFTELMQQVARTQVPIAGAEVAADLLRNGQLETTYYDFVYKPLYGPNKEVLGVIAIAVEVTGQVRARQQVQNLNEELAAINEELRASNDEYQLANTALAESQQALSELNQELEARVAERTQQLQATQLGAEAQRAELQRIFEQAPVAICVFRGPEYVLEIVNSPMGLMLGRSPAHLVGRPFFAAVSEVQQLRPLLDEVRRTGQPYVAQESPIHLARHQAGEVGYFNFVYQPLHNDQGLVTGVICVATEVTEQVHAREAVQATAQRLRLLTDALPVLISYLDREQRYQFMNHAYRSWFNRDPAALLGLTAREVVGNQAYAKVEDYIDRVLAGERLTFEAQMPYRGDFVRYIKTDYIPDIRQGQVHGFYALVTDVTEQVNAHKQVQNLNEELAAINEEMMAANEELRNTNDRLKHTNVDLDTFVYTASHDLKAPIANIEGLLLALREQLPSPVGQDPDVSHLLDLMHGSVARFQRTLGHLTDVSKLQQSHSEPDEAVDLAALAEAVRQDLHPALEATGGQLEVDVAECPTVRFSPKNLRSILYNLLSNAIKYHAPDRPPRVRLYARCVEHQVLLEVHDNGLGLTDAEQDKLFVMFRRLHTHVEGTGVGLYMVKRIAENAGGTIRVESRVGVGSTFTVVLPASNQTLPFAHT
jgi:PAS domain S-box-containing protein